MGWHFGGTRPHTHGTAAGDGGALSSGSTLMDSNSLFTLMAALALLEA